MSYNQTIARLSYNPYLQEAEANFNGDCPSATSQIEEHLRQPLSEWAHLMPQIFLDEMYGSNFDLRFTGTKSDFQMIRKAFLDCGIKENEVRLIHEKQIEGVGQKRKEVNTLFAWLLKSTNTYPAGAEILKACNSAHKDLYMCVLVGCDAPKEAKQYVNFKSVCGVKELDEQELKNIPILFALTDENVEEICTEIANLKDKITKEQLFFQISANSNKNRILKIVKSFGIKKIQIVEDGSDEAVLEYIRNYPMMEYVRTYLSLFKKIETNASERIKTENEELQKKIAEEANRIKTLETIITNAEAADIEIVAKGTKEINVSRLKSIRDNLDKKIPKQKQIEYASEEQLEKREYQYNIALEKQFANFQSRIQDEFASKKRQIKNEFKKIYGKAGVDLTYEAKCEELQLGDVNFQNIVEKLKPLRKIKEKQTGFLKNKKEFCITFDADDWMTVAKENISPIADLRVKQLSLGLQMFQTELADKYHNHLQDILQQKKREKEETYSEQIANEQKKEENEEWLESLQKKLEIIMLG